MTSVRRAVSVAVALLFAGGVLAACAPEPSPSPTAPDLTPTATDAPSPDPTATSTPSPAPTPDPDAPPAFTTGELAQICIDVTRSVYEPDIVFHPDDARIEKRLVTPEWLVLVPAQTNDYDAESVCTIGGTPEHPDIGLSSGSIQPLSEEQIQKLIRGENEGGTD